MMDDHYKIVCLFPGFDKINVTKDYGPFAVYLSRLNHSVKILTYKNNSNKNINHIDGVELIRITGNPRNSYSIDIPLIRYIIQNQQNIDCVIASFTLSNIIASIFFKIYANGFFILKMDSDGRLYRGNLGIRILKRLIGKLVFRILSLTSSLIIIETPEARRRILSLYPYLTRKLKLVPFGIDRKIWTKPISYDKKSPNKKILFTGRIEYGKGVDLLINAFSRLKNQYPDWILDLDGEVMPSFKDKLDKLIVKLEGRIIFSNSNNIKELSEKYAQADIFCFPSRYFHSLGPESFGVVLLEAMYFRNAILASNAGASEYVLDYGKAGLIFKTNDLEDLTKKLKNLMNDDNLRRKLAKNAQSRCENVFDWEQIILEFNKELIGLKNRE